jgi:hypothetical protein
MLCRGALDELRMGISVTIQGWSNGIVCRENCSGFGVSSILPLGPMDLEHQLCAVQD